MMVIRIFGVSTTEEKKRIGKGKRKRKCMTMRYEIYLTFA
jgi:hypothetical protein